MELFASDLEKLFNKHEIIPYSTWQNIPIDHVSEKFDKNYLGYIKSHIPVNTKGIYIYQYTPPGREKKDILYIGKSKNIHSRLFNHYKERHQLAGINNWPKFWKEHNYLFTVYFKEISSKEIIQLDEPLRIIVERYLIATLNPQSETLMYKSIK